LSFLPSQANELNGDQSYHEYRANHAVYRLHRVFSFAVPPATESDDWSATVSVADLQARTLALQSERFRHHAAEQPVTVDFNQTVKKTPRLRSNQQSIRKFYRGVRLSAFKLPAISPARAVITLVEGRNYYEK
jgi:hypothetical protein